MVKACQIVFSRLHVKWIFWSWKAREGKTIYNNWKSFLEWIFRAGVREERQVPISRSNLYIYPMLQRAAVCLSATGGQPGSITAKETGSTWGCLELSWYFWLSLSAVCWIQCMRLHEVSQSAWIMRRDRHSVFGQSSEGTCHPVQECGSLCGTED